MYIEILDYDLNRGCGNCLIHKCCIYTYVHINWRYCINALAVVIPGVGREAKEANDVDHLIYLWQISQ
jgi:hypothetical protein